MALPAMVLIPVSKARRVRRLAFSNMRTICLASRAWRYSRGLRLTSWPSLRMARTSALERSAMEHMSSPARRVAAARISGSFCTGTEVAGLVSGRSMVALLDMGLTSCSVSGSVCGSADSARMFSEDFVERSDGGVYVSALQNIRGQETQHRVAGAVD